MVNHGKKCQKIECGSMAQLGERLNGIQGSAVRSRLSPPTIGTHVADKVHEFLFYHRGHERIFDPGFSRGVFALVLSADLLAATALRKGSAQNILKIPVEIWADVCYAREKNAEEWVRHQGWRHLPGRGISPF